MGRIMYNYDARYYLTASLRRDGSSKFGANHQWGYFPSVAIAWRLTEEEFLKNVGWLNELKLSAGWGRTGNSDAINPYQTLLLLGGSGTFYNPATPAFNYRTAYSPSQNANPDLKWETDVQTDIGIDASFMRGALNVTVDWFRRDSKDFLLTLAAPAQTGYTYITRNVGSMRNQGWEIALNYNGNSGKDFQYAVNATFSTIKNTLTFSTPSEPRFWKLSRLLST